MESKHGDANCDLYDNCDQTFNNQLRQKNSASSQNNVSLCSQEKVKLCSWGLPEKILQFYETKGITQMLQWQLECLSLGNVLNSGNLVYSAPTSAGKTLVAEILIAKSVFELQKKALMILPFVSVVREKMFYFQQMYNSIGIHVEGYMGGHTPSVCFKQVHIAICTIEKANSIINRLLEEQNLHNLGLVVVDELHLLGDPYRGYLLELLLTKLKYISSKLDLKIQIVGMSATLPNLKSLADWLNADLYYTSFRPVPLNEKLKCGIGLYDKKLNKLSDLTPLSSEVVDDSENVGQLCLETIGNGHSVLIFCPTKVWCENLAEKISLFFKKLGCSKSAEIEGTPGWILRSQLNLKKINEVIEHLKMSPVGLDKDLQKVVLYGVAFHHAGLTLDERDIIEGSFRQGSIRVLCATSTLSSGVNLPARRVIIRSPMSFGGLMDVLTYRQMIGRAGRMGVDTEGESILICKPSEKTMCQNLMCSTLKPIESCLGHGRLSASLKRALLEIVASGISSTPEEVKKYASCTFLAFTSKHDMEDPIESCIKFLEENEFIRLQENGTLYIPTPLGKACLASSLPPDEGLALFRELQRARRCFVLDTDLHIIYQVTPYSVSEQWNKIDWMNVLNILESLPASMRKVGELVGVEEAFLVRVVKGSINSNCPENRNKLSIHRRFYTSLALQDLVNEVPLSEVAVKFECNKGMLQSLQQSAATFAGMVTEFTKRLGWGSVELIFSQFQERLQFGIRRELCELMRLPLLNAMRARTLYNAGFTNLSSIANASVTELENVFLSMAPFQSKKEIAGETTYDKEQRNKLETMWITGRADLSIREAAEMLVNESRSILELELGIEGAQWGRKSENSILEKTHNKTSSLTKESINVSKLNSSKKLNETCSFTNTSESNIICSEKVLDHNDSHDKKTYEKVPSEDVGFFQKNNINKEALSDYKTAKNVINTISDKHFVDGKVNEVDYLVNSDTKVSNIPNISLEVKVNSCDVQYCDKNNLDVEIIELKKGNNLKSIEEVPHVSILENNKNKTDYFASSFNFDMIIDYEVPENNSNMEKKQSSNKSWDDLIKNNELVTSDCESNGSVEILYDSTECGSTKNLSFSRLSEDIFEISRRGNDCKNMSTPISKDLKNVSKGDNLTRSRLEQTGSPDLFSQSLTFDTQLGKILDFEEPPGEDAPVIIKPSTSFNSDDLGFVSDLSPPKACLNQVQNVEKSNIMNDKKKDNNFELENVGISTTLFENGFKSPMEEKKEEVEKKSDKRKASESDSPDIIVDSDESMMDYKHSSKRIKHNSVTECDDIIQTPVSDKKHLSNFSNLSRRHDNSIHRKGVNLLSRRTSQKSRLFPRSSFFSKPHLNSSVNASVNKLRKVSINGCEKKWDKINTIDVCENYSTFKSFCEELKKQNTIGLAVGCRSKGEVKKSIIGAKIVKRRKIETTSNKSLECHYNDMVLDGIAFYWDGNDVFYMSLGNESIPLVEKMDFLKSLCSKPLTFRVFDAKEQIKTLYRCTSILLTTSYQDPKIASWLISEKWKDKNFPTIANEYLPESRNIVSLVGSIVGYSSPGLFFKSTISHRTRACCEAFVTFHLIEKHLPLLRGKGLEKLFENIEMPVMLCLAEMELTGFQSSRESLFNIKTKLDEAKGILEEKAYSLAKEKFVISSSVSVSNVLLKQLNLEREPVAMTNKKKLLSTTKQALQELANQTKHPLPEVILQWRKVRSMLSKFVSPLLLILSSDSTKVFGICQTFTVTGRINMHEPNLQNTPKNFALDCRTDELPTFINLREVFVASENCVLLSADYRQIELRMLAHLSQDLELIAHINNSSDIFNSIGGYIYGVPNFNVDDNLRQKIKQTCYGMIYGIGSRALSHQLDIEESEAERLMHDFKNKYPGVKNYLEQILDECKKKGYVSTLLGRRRYLPAINDTNQAIRTEAERQAVNTTIQGSAADLIKTAMILVRKNICELRSNGYTVNLVLHLHDELIYEVQHNIVEDVAAILKDTMENAMNLSVPIPVKLRTGPSWGCLKDFESV